MMLITTPSLSAALSSATILVMTTLGLASFSHAQTITRVVEDPNDRQAYAIGVTLEEKGKEAIESAAEPSKIQWDVGVPSITLEDDGRVVVPFTLDAEVPKLTGDGNIHFQALSVTSAIRLRPGQQVAPLRLGPLVFMFNVTSSDEKANTLTEVKAAEGTPLRLDYQMHVSFEGEDERQVGFPCSFPVSMDTVKCRTISGTKKVDGKKVPIQTTFEFSLTEQQDGLTVQYHETSTIPVNGPAAPALIPKKAPARQGKPRVILPRQLGRNTHYQDRTNKGSVDLHLGEPNSFLEVGETRYVLKIEPDKGID